MPLHRPVESEELLPASSGRSVVHHPRQLQLDIAGTFQSVILRRNGLLLLGGLVAQSSLQEGQHQVVHV